MPTSQSDKDRESDDRLQSLDLDTFSEALQARALNTPSNQKKELVKNALEVLSPEEQKAVINEVQGVGRPSNPVRDYLWQIIVWSFAIVLVGSFLMIAADVLFPYWFIQTGEGKDRGASAQLMLTIFTSVVGFLAGLFTPSPASKDRC
jgi:hypothetical protein